MIKWNLKSSCVIMAIPGFSEPIGLPLVAAQEVVYGRYHEK